MNRRYIIVIKFDFWCHQNGYRIAIVVDTVAEVLNLQKYLSVFGVTVSPLIGRSNRCKHNRSSIAFPEHLCAQTLIEVRTQVKIKFGDPFSALTLLEDMYREESEYRIPYSVYQSIYALIDMQDEDHIRQSTLWAVLESSCKSTDETFFNQMYRIWLNELGADFPLCSARFSSLRLLLSLI